MLQFPHTRLSSSLPEAPVILHDALFQLICLLRYKADTFEVGVVRHLILGVVSDFTLSYVC